MKKGFVVTAIIAVIVLAAPLSAQQIQYVGSTLWTDVNGIVVEDSTAFVLFNNGLITFDISDSSNYIELDRIFVYGGNGKMCINGNLALLLGRIDGLRIIDITNPSDLELLGEYNTPGSAMNIAVCGNYVYIADGDSGLQIINIINPAQPVLAGRFNSIPIVKDINISDSILYLIGGTGAYYGDRLYELNITDPTNPLNVGNGELIYALGAFKLEKYNNYAYILGVDLQHLSPYVVFDIINLSNIGYPSHCGGLGFQGLGGCMDIINDSTVILSMSSGCKVINTRDKNNPVVEANLYMNTLSSLYCKGDTSYYTSDQSLGAIDISNPFNPFIINQVNVCSPIEVICPTDNILYTVGSDDSLRILDISNVNNPRMISSLSTSHYNSDIWVKDTILYALFTYTFMTIDISDPQNPNLLCSLGNSNYGGNIFLLGNYAYVPSFTGMNIIDISDPGHLRYFSNFSFSGAAHDIDVRGSYVYITGGADGLIVADISDIINPIITGTCPIHNSPKGIKIREDRAYVLGNFNFFGVYDISMPQAPSLVAQLQINSGTALDISENRAYISSSQDGLIVLDLSNPTSPQIAETYPNVSANDVRFSHGYVYLATTSSVIIFRDLATGLDEIGTIPSTFSLSPNYPNPFNSSTTIRYNLPTESPVTIDIYDILGRKVQTLLDIEAQAGPHQANWNADGLPSGAYFARLKAGDKSQTMKMMLMK